MSLPLVFWSWVKKRFLPDKSSINVVERRFLRKSNYRSHSPGNVPTHWRDRYNSYFIFLIVPDIISNVIFSLLIIYLFYSKDLLAYILYSILILVIIIFAFINIRSRTHVLPRVPGQPSNFLLSLSYSLLIGAIR